MSGRIRRLTVKVLLLAFLGSPIPALAQGFPPGSTINFGRGPVGTISGQQLVVHVPFFPGATNTLEFTLSGDFRPGPSTTCPYPGIFLPPSTSCDFYVEFAPTVAGTRTGQLELILGLCFPGCFNQFWYLTGVGLSQPPPPPPPPPPPLSPCDINGDGKINVVDVQLIVNQALGIIPATSDLDHDGDVDVIEVQRVVNAVLGLSCKTN